VATEYSECLTGTIGHFESLNVANPKPKIGVCKEGKCVSELEF